MWRPSIFILAVVLSSVYSAPQELISFKDGKIGVNFGGYHAGVGIGGILGGSGGAGGGLFAEAGTPHGQAARAGLGGAVDGSGQNSGGLYAGATAGGNVRAHAGLAGGVTGGKSEGVGFATAQAGDRVAHSGLGGEASVEGSHGYKFAGTETGVNVGVEKTEFIQPVELPIAKVHKKVHKEFKFETENELKPVQPAASSGVEAEAGINVKTNVQPINIHPASVVVKEVSNDWTPRWNNDYRHAFDFHGFFSPLFRNPVGYQRPWIDRKIARLYQVFAEPPPVFVEKRIRYKPRHHHRKHAYFGGYIGADAAPPAPVVYKTVEVSRPVIQKRIDVQTYAGHDVAADASAQAGGAADIGYRKQVTFQRNPTFFADIFNIPIQTLKAVGGFLSNSAGSTSVSVQKTASINAEPELISSKHAPSVSSSSGGEISIKTPTASKFIDDIFAIPINTLGAVNKFLENNVQRKQVIQEGESQVHVRLGPHARRRANKEVVIVRESEASANVE